MIIVECLSVKLSYDNYKMFNWMFMDYVYFVCFVLLENVLIGTQAFGGKSRRHSLLSFRTLIFFVLFIQYFTRKWASKVIKTAIKNFRQNLWLEILIDFTVRIQFFQKIEKYDVSRIFFIFIFKHMPMPSCNLKRNVFPADPNE